MKNLIVCTLLLLLLLPFFACKESSNKFTGEYDSSRSIALADVDDTRLETAIITPIEHATAVITWQNKTMFIDPVGGAQLFSNFNGPDLIFITDIHGDHFNLETLEGLDVSKAKIIVPRAVADQIPEPLSSQLVLMDNGNREEILGITIEAVPMYNLREEAKQFHTKGRGNGYVITLGEERIYFSGDTEDIPEMRALKNIDKAFICMNLPYTMTEKSAASAVLAFKPRQVYPYHYRGNPNVSDVSLFKNLVNEGDPDIEVILLDWYPNDDF